MKNRRLRLIVDADSSAEHDRWVEKIDGSMYTDLRKCSKELVAHQEAEKVKQKQEREQTREAELGKLIEVYQANRREVEGQQRAALMGKEKRPSWRLRSSLRTWHGNWSVTNWNPGGNSGKESGRLKLRRLLHMRKMSWLFFQGIHPCGRVPPGISGRATKSI